MTSSQEKKFALAAHPVNWYEVAKLMHENAQSLYRMPQGKITFNDGVESLTTPTSNRAVFLLAAFAMENLLKAFLIYENPQYIKGGKLSRHLLNSHGLSKLQKKCKKIPSPKRTLHVCEELEIGINSWARYPCATSLARESKERPLTTEFWGSYEKAFDLCSKKLEQLLSKGWKEPYGEKSYVKFTH